MAVILPLCLSLLGGSVLVSARRHVDSALVSGLQLDRADAVRANANTTLQSCPWEVMKCCCQPVMNGSTVNVNCKRWTTGMVKGQEVCGCANVDKEWFGFEESPYSPETWASGFSWMKLRVKAGKEAALQALEDMDAACHSDHTPVAFEGEQPDGSCTVSRLYEHTLPKFMEGRSCASDGKKKALKAAPKLGSSVLLKSYHRRLSQSALLGCVSIGEGCAKSSFKASVLQTVVDNLDTGFLWIGEQARSMIMDYAKEALKVEADLDDETAKLLLDWAFYHEEGKNAYCDTVLMESHRDMLVKGLTASAPDHVRPERPWTYSEEQVFKPFHDLLTITIEGMFQADCVKLVEPEISEARAREGQGLQVVMTPEEKAKILADINATVAEQDFMSAHELHMELGKRNVAEPLLPYRDIPLIATLLDYVQSPTVQHPIEANEADLVRKTLKTLGALLSDEVFVGHLRRSGGRLDDWTMPPEVLSLWAKTRSAKHGERIWEDELVSKLREQAPETPTCNCEEIEPGMGLHMLNQLPLIGLDFGNVKLGKNRTLISDKRTETLQHVDLKALTRTMIMVEAGIQDPQLATKYISQKLLRGAESTGSQSGVPDVSASGKVKGVLVGMPIVQNLWALLEKENNFSPDVFAKKMKWFFVANIIWAVWHAIEDNLPPEDIILGLVTIVMSTLSSFDYDGKWITFSNSKAFTDYMLAVYTVWNYRFVKQWASQEKPEDQWMHVSIALSMPIIESLANHGDASYYINYRRDDLFHAMLLMMERQQAEGKPVTGRCCCDWDTRPGFVKDLFRGNEEKEAMEAAQRCVLVPDTVLTSSGKCPYVKAAKWAPLSAEKEELLDFEDSGKEYLKLHHDQEACDDASKVLNLPANVYH